MRIRSKAPTAEQLAARKSLEAALLEHQQLDPIEMVAVVSHALGQLIALQDQTRFTPDQVMQLVAANIEAGNQEVIASLRDKTGGRA